MSNGFYIGIQNTGGNGQLVVKNQTAGSDLNGEWWSGTGISIDAWHTIELIVNSQSALGAADGSFRVFLDDVEVTDFSWVSGPSDPAPNAVEWYRPSNGTRLFSGIQMFLYWGGSTGVKAVNDFVDLSELYITGAPAIN